MDNTQNMSRRTFVLAAGATATVAGVAAAAPAIARATEGTATDGTYNESAEGRNGLVTVETTITGGAISKVEVTDHQETETFTSEAIARLCEEIVTNNSYGIDGVSGATFTSAAILSAVQKAVEEAGGSDEVYNVPSSYPDAKDETADVDVVVVGAGLSGVMAAATAAQKGAKVALVDKVGLIGGCSRISFAVAQYLPENVREAMTTWIEGQMYLCDPTLVYAYLSNDAAAIDYINSSASTKLFPYVDDPTAFFPGMMCDYMDRPGIYQELLDNTVVAGGGAIYLDSAVDDLITDDEGAVVGVTATRRDGSKLMVNAKAVVIATGGYGGDTKRLSEWSGWPNLVCGCLTQDVGDGMDLAWAAGAQQPASMGAMMLHQTLATAKLRGYEYFQQQMPMILGYVPSVLNLTTAGVRFRNEDWVNTATAAAGSGAYAGGLTFAMLDQAMVDALIEGGTAAIGFTESPGMPPEYKPEFEPDTPWNGFQGVLDDCVENDWAYKGDTLEDLAKAAGMDPTQLALTVDTYNEYCDAGDDAYFGKAPEHLVPLKQGPFYLVGITYNQLGTVGGIIVNDQFQVLDPDHKAIPGLYSAGADCYGTCWNRNYYGNGDGMGFALTSGYVCGPKAAEYALGK